MSEQTWRSLGIRAVAGCVLALVAVAALRLGKMYVQPMPAVVIGITIGVLSWLWMTSIDPPDQPYFVRPQPPVGARRYAADRSTRRMASMLLSGRSGFDARAVARLLQRLTAQRLVRNHHADPEDPLAQAERHLSRGLLKYLMTPEDETPPPLTRKVMRSYLKEIDRL